MIHYNYDQLWNVRGFCVAFSWVFWSKRGKPKNKGGISHLVCVKRCYILEQPKRLHSRIAWICLYLPLFSLFSFSMKRSEKTGPFKILWNPYELNVHSSSYFPSYRLHVTRSGYAMTVSGPATSARLKFFVKMMLIKHRYKSKTNEPTTILFHMMAFYFGESTWRY